MVDDYQALRAVPLREQVYESLESLILDGRLKAGERLVETELAAKLGVSRGPIREALQHLVRDGWIEARPRQGTYVREPEENELQDYFQIRTLLELEAVSRAAAMVRTHAPDLAPRLEQLYSLLIKATDLSAGLPADQSSELTRDQATKRAFYRRASRAFHHTIAEMTGSPALVDLLEYLSKRTRWYSSFSYTDRLGEHAKIIDAIAAGDGELAVSLMRDHLKNMSNVSVQTLRGSRDSQATE